MKKKIGIVGCGTIGTALARAVRERFSHKGEIAAVNDIDREKAAQLGNYLSIAELVTAVDLVIETANPQMVRELVPLVMKNGKEILVLSTGGLLDIPLPLSPGIHFPSGAVAGLDGLRAASFARIDKITLTTTKPPQALGDKEYDKDTVIFRGTAAEAIVAFPKNINVCATLALVSGKPELVTVNIVASPAVTRNTHQVDIEGDFGHITCHMRNEPSPDNPKTSFLAVLSAIAKLDELLSR